MKKEDRDNLVEYFNALVKFFTSHETPHDVAQIEFATDCFIDYIYETKD